MAKREKRPLTSEQAKQEAYYGTLDRKWKFTTMTNEEYHSCSGVNASFLKAWIKKSPMHAMYPQGGGISQIVADVGTAVHSMALEPHREDVVASDETSRATKAFKEHYAHCKAQGKVLLPRKDFTMVQRMVFGSDDNGAQIGGLYNDEHCGKLLRQKDRICEASIFVRHEKTRELLRIRPDIYSPELKAMGDIKTCQDASPEGFGKVIWNLGYNLQAAFYCMAAEAYGWEVKTFGFLAVEKTYPHLAHFHILSPEAMEYSRRVVESALREYADARETKAFGHGWGSYTVQDIPGYLTWQTEE